ncbi:bifunctional 5,10-methylenetetrahydrofolate dehydrogenase/5,10-methenyltetrahydrofolate cyclohydrolase [Elusimicrobiota bacterium]
MSAIILDGKTLAAKIRRDIGRETAPLKEKYSRGPGLATVLVGEDPASAIYVRNKIKACSEAGLATFDHKLAQDTPENELLRILDDLNANDQVDGILLQLPLPKHINTPKAVGRIKTEKDVDGFGPENFGKLYQAKSISELDDIFIPCTPQGILRLIELAGVSIAGKFACVIGRSNIVGKPIAHLLMLSNATTVICHTKTGNLNELAAMADIIVSATGRLHNVTASMVKNGACVIDVGMNRKPDGKLAGDCDFDDIKEKAGSITPVPGGVGPMTIAMLLSNTLKAFKHANCPGHCEGKAQGSPKGQSCAKTAKQSRVFPRGTGQDQKYEGLKQQEKT